MSTAVNAGLETDSNAANHGKPGSVGLAEIGASGTGSGDVTQLGQATHYLGESPGCDRQPGLHVGSERVSSGDAASHVGREADVYTFREFIDLELERPKHTVQDLLAEGQNALIIGRFAIGKTLIALQLSVSLATGRDFLGRGVKCSPKFRQVAKV